MKTAITNDIYFNLDRVLLLMRRKLRDIFGEHKVSPEQWEIMQYLSEETGLTQGKLMNVTLKDKGNISRIVARMERDGAIERRPLVVNGLRTMSVYLTAKGAQIRDSIPSQLMAHSANIFATMSNEERDVFLQTLKKLRIHLGDSTLQQDQ